MGYLPTQAECKVKSVFMRTGLRRSGAEWVIHAVELDLDPVDVTNIPPNFGFEFGARATAARTHECSSRSCWDRVCYETNQISRWEEVEQLYNKLSADGYQIGIFDPTARIFRFASSFSDLKECVILHQAGSRSQECSTAIDLSSYIPITFIPSSAFTLNLGTISHDQAIRNYKIYIHFLIENISNEHELKPTEDDVVELCLYLLENDLSFSNLSSTLQAGIQELIDFVSSNTSQNCCLIEHHAWIRAAILDYLVENKIKKFIGQEAFRFLVKHGEQINQQLNDVSFDKKLTDLKDDIVLVLKNIVAVDWVPLTYAGIKPKGVILLEKVISSCNLSPDQILTQCVLDCSKRASHNLFSIFFNSQIRGRDDLTEILYQTLEQINLNDVESLNNTLTQLNCLYYSLGGQAKDMDCGDINPKSDAPKKAPML